MHGKRKFWSLIGLIVLVLAIILAIVVPRQGQKQQTVKKGTPITIASKDFTESKIVMQIWADQLRQKGYQVTTKPNISSSVVYQAIKSKQVDLYPEYTGTIAMTYLKGHIIGKSAPAIAQTAKKGMAKQGLTTLAYAPGNDSQGIAIRTKIAKKYNIYNISELQKQARHIRYASQGEFDKREDGLPGLTKAYGKFSFKSRKVYDQSLKYKILAKGEGDICPASTTEGPLATKQFLTLKDNKHFYPAYNLVPLMRTAVLKKDPGIRSILNKLDAKLTTKELTKLNYQVDVQGKSYQSVARAWVKKNA